MKVDTLRRKLLCALGSNGVIVGDNEVARLVLLCDMYEDLETAIEDFKCARTAHHNATPENRSSTMTVYDDIIGRLEAVYASLDNKTKG